MHGIFFKPPLEDNYFGHIFEEVYKTCIFKSVIPKNQKGIVVDIGGNVGITSYYFSSKFEKVYTIEPSTRHWEVLNYMLEYNKIKNIFPYKFALSSLNGEETFYHFKNRTMDSLYGSKKNPEIEGTEIVKLKRLDTFIKEENIDHIDLLKLDCEGLEFEILESESFSNCCNKIDNIVCEIHKHSGRNPKEIFEILMKKGFLINKIINDANIIIAKRN